MRNVIRFGLEITKGRRARNETTTVLEQIRSTFLDDLDSSEDAQAAINEQWLSIPYKQLKALQSEASLLAYTNIETAQIFIFRTAVVQGRNNCSVDVIAHGDMNVEELLNTAFKRIRSITKTKRLKCNFIDKTQMFIYPFNSYTNDISTYDLKIRANTATRFNVGLTEFVKWAIFVLIAVISLVLYLESDAAKDGDWLVVTRTVWISFFIALIVDLIALLVVPLLSNKRFRRVFIGDLSGVVAADEQRMMPVGQAPKLEMPRAETQASEVQERR